MQRRSRGLLGVSASQKRVSTRERDQAEADRQRREEATKIWAKIEKHVNDTSWGEVKKEGEGERRRREHAKVVVYNSSMYR